MNTKTLILTFEVWFMNVLKISKCLSYYKQFRFYKIHRSWVAESSHKIHEQPHYAWASFKLFFNKPTPLKSYFEYFCSTFGCRNHEVPALNENSLFLIHSWKLPHINLISYKLTLCRSHSEIDQKLLCTFYNLKCWNWEGVDTAWYDGDLTFRSLSVCCHIL